MNLFKDNKKPVITYYIIVLAILLLLNALVFPKMIAPQIQPVDYSTFLTMLDEGKIVEVEIGDDAIAFNAGTPEVPELYSTGRMEDDGISDKLYAAGVKFTRVITDDRQSILSVILSWVLPLALIFLFGQWMMKSLAKRMGGGGGNVMQFGKSNAKVYVKAETGTTFKDVAGQDEAKEALNEIVDFLHDPKKYTSIGAHLPKGALLVGPPGTGKTLLAKAVAGEAKVPFFSISGSEFVEMFVGMGAARVRDLFKQASEKAPCIVFIDEIDTIGKSRAGGGQLGGNDEREQTLNQLLSEMDGFDADKGVVILAATNRPESLDKALLRPGRFDRRIPVELPDLNGREAILKVHAIKVNMDASVNLRAIALATSGSSGADLANIINEAALNAVRAGRATVQQADMEEAVEVVIAGYQRKNSILNERDKLMVAYHEIGHALVAAKQGNSAPVQKITIVPRTSGALGYTLQVDTEEKVLLTKEDIQSRLASLTGGRAAEEIVFNTMTTGASNDIEQATKLARNMVTRYGMSDTFGMTALETMINPYLSADTQSICSSETAAKVDVEVRTVIESAHKKATEILTENIDLLHSLARHLYEKETITGDEFMKLLSEKGAETNDDTNKDNGNI